MIKILAGNVMRFNDVPKIAIRFLDENNSSEKNFYFYLNKINDMFYSTNQLSFLDKDIEDFVISDVYESIIEKSHHNNDTIMFEDDEAFDKKIRLFAIEYIRFCYSIVKEFIDNFKHGFEQECEKIFTQGNCYYFANILKDRFNGQLYYNPIDNHFACCIGNKLYDITGEISDTNDFKYWKYYNQDEPIDSARIYKYCVFKNPKHIDVTYSDNHINNFNIDFISKEE